MDKLQINLSAVDEQRFGIRTARAYVSAESEVDEMRAFCAEHQVRFLIVRVPSEQLHTVQLLETLGGQMMDTLIYYRRDLTRQPLPDLPPTPPQIRSITDADVSGVQRVAQTAFTGYFGHYHADKRLDPALSDAGYVEWAVRSSTVRGVADDVLVADDAGAIVGFATMRINSPTQGEGVLFGVAPEAQGRGIYRGFIIHAMHWCADRALKEIVVSTQITNIAVQKVWVRLGFEPSHSFYTLHHWFD
jgi:GNAT superfamily N-acetyltransferase